MTVSAYRRFGWGVSIGIHFILFLILAYTGFFSGVQNTVQYTDATLIYTAADTEAADSYSGGSSTGSSAVTAGDIAISSSESQKLYGDSQNPSAAYEPAENKKSAASSDGQSVSNGGAGASAGSAAAGNGRDTGTGNGAGNSSGSGTGTGDTPGDGANALRATVAPVPVNAPTPSYPDSMRSSGMEGHVTVMFTVGTSGGIEDVSVASSSGEAAFDQAALSAARQWSFSPARNINGQAVRCRISQTFQFRMDD